MKDHNPHDPVNMIGEAYELFVERAMQDLHVRDGTDSKNPSKPTHRVIKSSDAPSQKSLWIENKKFLLKNSALEYLQHAGDKTTITLRRLNQAPNTSDKLVENENNAPNKLHGHRAFNTTMHSEKNNAHQYKKCDNKTFRRLQ